MTPKQRDQLSGMAAVFAQGSLIDYVADLLAQARADALEEAATLCAEPERREDYMGGKTWVECAAAIRARKDGQ